MSDSPPNVVPPHRRQTETPSPSRAPEPAQSGYADEPAKSGYADEPKESGYADEPAKSGYADEPKESGYADEPKERIEFLFGLPLARWSKRVLAFFLDIALFSGLGALLLYTAVGPQHYIVSNPDNAQIRSVTHYSATFWGLAVLVLALQIAYFTIMNGSPNGRTVGKEITGIAVRDAQSGGSIGYGRAFLRILLVLLMILPYAIPFLINSLWPFFDPYRRCWHDLAARSVVLETGPARFSLR